MIKYDTIVYDRIKYGAIRFEVAVVSQIQAAISLISPPSWVTYVKVGLLWSVRQAFVWLNFPAGTFE